MCKRFYGRLRPPYEFEFPEDLDFPAFEQLPEAQLNMLMAALEVHQHHGAPDEIYLKCYLYVITVLFLCMAVYFVNMLFNRVPE